MKTIGVEVVRVYAIEVDDDVDTDDWLKVGLLLSDDRTPPEIVDMLAWDLPDGDIHSRESSENEDKARRRRLQQAIAIMDAQFAQRLS